jgi:4-hydroxy-tetrahydrodipicolinate synthase
LANPRFSGSLVALITPFKGDGAGNPDEIDEAKLRALVEYHIKNGTDGLVPCGTTGESVTLDESEHDRVGRIVVETAAGRVPVIAGAGTNSTVKTIKYAKAAQAAGADGILVVTPYYNKPTQQGLFLHFEAVAKAADLPLVVYNVPSRTSVNMLPETLARLAKIDSIVGVKEASGSLDQVSQVVAACPTDFAVLSGDDSLTLPLMSIGGKGVISVASNIIPAKIKEMTKLAAENNFTDASVIHRELFPFIKSLFLDGNPVGIKYAMKVAGLDTGELRLPLWEASETTRKTIEQNMAKLGIKRA